MKSRDHTGGNEQRGHLLGVLAVVLAALIVSSCAAKQSSPQEVVKRFWEALAKNDQSAMLNCLQPDLRSGANPFGCILPAGDWGIVISQKLGVELSGTAYELLDEEGDTAHVGVTGRVKLPDSAPLVGGIIREFRITHALVRQDRQWFLTCP